MDDSLILASIRDMTHETYERGTIRLNFVIPQQKPVVPSVAIMVSQHYITCCLDQYTLLVLYSPNMFPSPYVPQACSPVPMFPQLVHQSLFSQSKCFPNMFPKHVPQCPCSPVHMIPSAYVPPTSSPVPMFPIPIPQKCFPFIVPTHDLQSLCSPVFMFPKHVPQCLRSPVPMLPCPYVPPASCLWNLLVDRSKSESIWKKAIGRLSPRHSATHRRLTIFTFHNAIGDGQCHISFELMCKNTPYTYSLN